MMITFCILTAAMTELLFLRQLPPLSSTSKAILKSVLLITVTGWVIKM